MYMTQLGFMPHCGLRAMSQCQWTTFYDLDEFYVHPKVTLSERLAALPTKVGAMRANMYAVRSHKVYPTMPEGGVLRNFWCPVFRRNHKTVLRADAVERNFIHFVHSISVDSEHETVHDFDGDLVHYSFLSLDVFGQKLRRRASFTMEQFFLKGDREARVKNEYYDYFANYTCLPPPPTYGILHCHATQKYVPRMAYRGENHAPYECLLENDAHNVRSVAVVGDRAGVGAIRLEVGSTVGKVWRIGHPGNGQPRYRRLVHVVEHPLLGVELLMQEQEKGTSAEDAALIKAPYTVRLLAAMLEWVNAHQMFYLVADARVKVEELRECRQLCAVNDTSACQQGCSIAPLPAVQLATKPSWSQMWGLNPHLTHVLIHMAREFGYAALELPKRRVDEPAMLSADQWPGGRWRAADMFVKKFWNATLEGWPSLNAVKNVLRGAATQVVEVPKTTPNGGMQGFAECFNELMEHTNTNRMKTRLEVDEGVDDVLGSKSNTIPIVAQVLREVATRTLDFNSLFYTPSLVQASGEIPYYELPLAVYMKMCAIFESQARSLCALPKDECSQTGHCAVLSNGTCASILSHRLTADALVRARQNGGIGINATNDLPLEYRPEVRVSINTATEHGGFFYTHDMWRLGYDSVKEQLIGGSPQMKRMAEMFDKVRNMRCILLFLKKLTPREATLFTSPLDKYGVRMLETIGDQIAARNLMLNAILITYKCNKLYEQLGALCEVIRKICAERQSAAEQTGKLKTIVEQLVHMVPAGMVDTLVCSLIQALYDHFMLIMDLRCDLQDKDSCLASGGHCVWRLGQCYNPLLFNLRTGLFGGVPGLAKPIMTLRDEYAAMLRRPAHQMDPRSFGVREVMMAIFGEEFVKNFPLMKPIDQMRAMERALKQTEDNVKEMDGVRMGKLVDL